MSDEKKYTVIIEESAMDEEDAQDSVNPPSVKAQKQNRSAWIITVVIVVFAVLVSAICIIGESAAVK